ncbi:hypothetical protein O6H91_01G029700 [Diphasiastrum complanatum]|nr:hypothetical protein O6H91_01G029700 [Diphasiastrum complanatum]
MSNVDTFGEHKSDTSRKTISLSGKNYKSPLWSLDSPQKPSSTEPQAYILRKRTAAEAFIQDNQQERSVSKLNKNFQKEEQKCACMIVANIVLSGGFILSSRRSSYQNILNLEKRGIQVVERELRLPVDLILSAAVCLVLYTNEKFNFYTDSSYQGMTSLSPCLENIIDNHLKAISFSFKSCILIFEGPDEFTSRILANIDEVYAAAVGLNIRIQCFTSRNAAVTDTIVLGCIEAVQRSNAKKSFPLMTEARTLAEAFLTEFPSVNPLTAHAILCSGIPLPIFMSLTHDQQLTATKEFELPEHSMMLFNIQCQYEKTVCKARVSTDQNNPPMMKFEILQRSEEDPSVMHEWPIDDKGIAGGDKGIAGFHQLNHVAGLSPGSDVRIANLLNDKIDGRHANPQQQQSAVRTSFLEDCEREPGETQKWKLGYPDIYTYQRELDPSYSEFRASPPYFPPTKDMDFDINLPWEDQPLHMKYQLSGQVSEHSIVTAMEDNNILGRQPMYSFKSGCNEGEDVQLGSVQAVLKDWLHTREKTREISLIGNRRQAYKFPDAGHHKLKHPLPGSSTMSKRFQEQATPRKTNNLKTPQTPPRKHFKKLDHSVWKNYSFKPSSSIDSLNKNKWTRSSLSTPSPKVPDFQILSAIKTPDDKKASQSLTYKKIGTDKQSRLIWSDIRSTKN